MIPAQPAFPPAGSGPRPKAPRGLVFSATALLSGFALFQGPSLWHEWQGLRDDWRMTRASEPFGFVDISPHLSFAQPPEDWARHQADSTLLWSGWDRECGHTWFRIGRDDLDVSTLNRPMGRDIVRAIDQPLVERGSGIYWDKLRDETPVFGVRVASSAVAYPMLVLEKVEVVNDTVGGRPILVTFTPFLPKEEAVDVFDPLDDDQRYTFGWSGYIMGPEQRPLLYDRRSESLWQIRPEGLVCLAGADRGVVLPRLGRPRSTTWGEWRSEHGNTSLVVGAQRSSRKGRSATPPRSLVTAL